MQNMDQATWQISNNASVTNIIFPGSYYHARVRTGKIFRCVCLSVRRCVCKYMHVCVCVWGGVRANYDFGTA